MPLFCVALGLQLLIIYGLFAFAGLRLARARNRQPAPWLSALWVKSRPPRIALRSLWAFGTGAMCGLVLVGAIELIKRVFPQTLPAVLHPPSLWGALLASATASFGEEILFRLFLLSAFLRILPISGKSTALGVAVSSLLFGAMHAPAAVVIFGGLSNVPPLFWLWMMLLNALVGVACALWFLGVGIEGAIIVHFGADVVWHVMSQMH
jgi:membrane protease YdiL (CAAX protease family)